MLPHNLDAISTRVLGALIEKELSTPDHYPLSLHALTSACNQTSNRDPVMTLDDDTVSRALDALRRGSLVRSFQGIGSRVPKYQHLLEDGSDLSRNELALLCVLALRGPQTLAELRVRAVRLMSDGDANAIEGALETMMAQEQSVVIRLPRRAGQKEVRYAHTLGGEVAFDAEFEANDASVATPSSSPADRIAALEEITTELKNEIADLRAGFAAFRRQFE